MYQKLQDLESRKKTIIKYQKALEHLKKENALTTSGAKKRQFIPICENEIARLTSEFNAIVPSVIEWTKTIESEKKDFAQIIRYHYCDIKQPPSELANNIENFNPYLNASNFRDAVFRMYLKDLCKQTL